MGDSDKIDRLIRRRNATENKSFHTAWTDKRELSNPVLREESM